MNDTEELPPHVLANIRLAHELECEYWDRVYPRRNRGVSSTANYFRGWSRSPEATKARNDYFDELREANEALDRIAEAQRPAPPADNYEDVIKAFGGRFVGEAESI